MWILQPQTYGCIGVKELDIIFYLIFYTLWKKIYKINYTIKKLKFIGYTVNRAKPI